MTPLAIKLVQAFSITKRVVHFYYVHTDGDENGGRTSVQNIKRIIERITQLPIETYRVTSDGPSVRGNFERYSDRIVILVRSQSDEWERFTAIKELCHALIDGEEDYSSEGVETIRELVTNNGWLDDEASAQVRSEQLAERMALELIYPLEFRRQDMATVEEEGFAAIGVRRGVPVTWVERALNVDHITACESVWKVLGAVDGALGADPVPHEKPYYRTADQIVLKEAS